jgi:hypothetical protein
MDIIGIAKKVVKKAAKEIKVIKGEEAKDKIYSSKNTLENPEVASTYLKEAIRKLFDINAWSTISAVINSNFQLFNSLGEKSSNTKPVIGDYIRIQLPGGLPYNWVKVMDIKEEDNFSEFTVSPSEDPTESKNNDQVKHFFVKEATSTFKVERQGNTIVGYEIGKEEAVNNKNTKAGNRAALNTVVAEGGWAGVQKIQWQNLTDYLVGIK